MKLTVNEALLSSLETMMPGARVWALEFIAGGGGGASQVYIGAHVYKHSVQHTYHIDACVTAFRLQEESLSSILVNLQ